MDATWMATTGLIPRPQLASSPVQLGGVVVVKMHPAQWLCMFIQEDVVHQVFMHVHNWLFHRPNFSSLHWRITTWGNGSILLYATLALKWSFKPQHSPKYSSSIAETRSSLNMINTHWHLKSISENLMTATWVSCHVVLVALLRLKPQFTMPATNSENVNTN